MANTPKDTSLENYYYAEQLRHHIVQFMAVFSGLKVSVGKNDFNSQTNLIEVPIVYGSRDRVVSHIFSDNTQNKMLRLPMMSAQLTGMEIALERLTGQGQERKEVKLKRGGIIPDDLQQLTTLQSIPYRAQMELFIHTTNTDHQFQMLEQILLLFDPSLQIQVSDAYGNRQSIVQVFLENITLDENYPAGNDNRIISATLNFSYVFYLTPPSNLKDEIIKSIKIRLQALNQLDSDPAALNDGKVDPFIISTIGAPKQ
jgi:hypothetical protein